MKNHSLSRLIGPPIAPLKFWMCAIPFALVTLRARSSSSTLSDCHVPVGPAQEHRPLTMLPPSFGIDVQPHAAPAVSAGIALVMTLASAASASSQ